MRFTKRFDYSKREKYKPKTERKETEKEENTNKYIRFRRRYDEKTSKIIEKKEEEKSKDSSYKFIRKRLFNNNFKDKFEELGIKDEQKEVQKRQFRIPYFALTQKLKSDLDEKILEKLNLDSKEDKKQEILKKNIIVDDNEKTKIINYKKEIINLKTDNNNYIKNKSNIKNNIIKFSEETEKEKMYQIK